MITYFKSINDTSAPYHVDVSVAIDRIRNGKSKELVEAVRNESDKNARNEKKKKLPAICFSGTFSKRADNAIIEHSGIICIDFDGFRDEQHLFAKRQELIDDNYSFCVFTSPSGDGIKVLVRIPKDPKNHKKYFNSLQKHYNCEEFDVTCKNISRVCYESYDPDVHVNELALIWSDMDGSDDYKPAVRPMIKVDDTNEITRRLTLWWIKNYGMIPGHRNNNLYILACAFNEFGVDKQTARSIIDSYDTNGEMAKEIPTLLESAYRNTAIHNTKFYEDIDKTVAIKNDIKVGVPLQKIVEVYKDVPSDVIEHINSEENPNNFWTKSSKGKIDLVPHLLRDYLSNNGFYKYYPDGSKNFVFIRIQDNVIRDSSEEIIKDFILDYLEGINDMSVYNYFAMNTKFFTETFLNFLPKIDARFMTDDSENAYLYYNNCAVKVTRRGIERIEYKDLKGLVWEDQKIKRNFTESAFDDCEYKRFITNISGDDKERIKSVESTIGYLMHSHKPASYCPAVILNDEVISDNPEGGTGKGIFVKSVSHMKKMVIIDGKGFSFQKSFPYQRVQVDTQVLVFDDVSKHFDFERLFSVITEGITLEKKNKDEIHIPFERSPKIVITTNYAIKGAGNSFERRKWDLELKQYYNKSFTPETEFGHMLFSGWDEYEWNKFDNYMISNLQSYLNKGLVRSEFKNLKTRKFIAETSSDFWEWAVSNDNVHTKAKIKSLGQDLFNSFTQEYPDYATYGRFKISQNKFYRWIDSYGEFAFGTKPTVSRTALGKNIEFIVKENEQLNLKL
jgi:hypothetical protein